MKIQTRFLAHLGKYLPGGNATPESSLLEIREHATVGEVLTDLGVPSDAPKVVLVNYRAAALDQVLNEGDALTLFPPVAGG